MKNKFIISLSPHVHGDDSVEKNMYGVVLALIPALLLSFYFFGLGAAVVTVVSVVGCIFFEWAITKFMLRKEPTITDGSALLTGLLLAFNLPSNLPIWMILIGALVAIGIGKMTFGGLGCNPFNPALVGRVFLLISFPAAMTSWPKAGQLLSYTDAQTGATPLSIMKWAVKSNDFSVLEDLPSTMDLFLGKIGGSLGEISALALLLGLAFMLWRKIISWHIPVSILATVIVLSSVMHAYSPAFASPLQVLFSGGLILGACFMATDYVTSPMTSKGQLIYGVSIGVLTLVIRYFGAYPEGMSFAILIMNAFVPLINMYCKPVRFGKEARK